MIVEILVAQRQPVHPLRHQFPHAVRDQPGVAVVLETGPQSRQQIQPLVRLAQQQRSTIRGHGAAVEPRPHTARKMPFKLERFLVTLCHSKSRCLLALTVVWKLSYARCSGFLLVGV